MLKIVQASERLRTIERISSYRKQKIENELTKLQSTFVQQLEYEKNEKKKLSLRT